MSKGISAERLNLIMTIYAILISAASFYATDFTSIISREASKGDGIATVSVHSW